MPAKWALAALAQIEESGLRGGEAGGGGGLGPVSRGNGDDLHAKTRIRYDKKGRP